MSSVGAKAETPTSEIRRMRHSTGVLRSVEADHPRIRKAERANNGSRTRQRDLEMQDRAPRVLLPVRCAFQVDPASPQTAPLSMRVPERKGQSNRTSRYSLTSVFLVALV